MNDQAEIISIGTELLMGETIDTNAKYLAAELALIGIEAGRATTVGDDKDRLTAVFREALARTDIVLASGGLGPTDDDLTRECLAEVLGEAMTVDPSLEKQLRDFFSRFGRRNMPPHNLRQAMLIPSAEPVPNPNGTAPGWWVEKNGKIIVLLPGPPRELEPMWRNEIKPRLIAKFPGKVTLTRTLKVFGMAEATVNELIQPFFHMENPSLGIYAKTDGINLRLIARGPQAAGLIEKAEKGLRDILKGHVWGVDEESLAGIVFGLLSCKQLTMAVFEDGTGGIISDILSGADTAAKSFRGSLITMDEKSKIDFGVPAGVLANCGPISSEVAEAMAAVAREKLGTDIGLSVTGISGIDSPDEATGTAFVGIADSKGTISWRQVIIPRRNIARNHLAMAALNLLREKLIN